MARDDPHFRLRIPEELKAAIEDAAEVAGRSLNAEILHRLKASFEKHDAPEVEIVRLKPIGISHTNAAALLGLSLEAFDHLVEKGELPRPRLIGSEKIWARELVEAAADRWLQVDLFGGSPAIDAEREARQRAQLEQKREEQRARIRKKRQEAEATRKPKSA